MTKTAANIGFAHWSHDVGGFIGNPSDELYVRWTQAAALWPLYRSHGKKGTERRYWLFPSFELMKQSLVLRAVVSPYVYSAAAAAHASGVGAVRSMYVDYPTEATAYGCDLQYMHGDDLIVRPVVSALGATSRGSGSVGGGDDGGSAGGGGSSSDTSTSSGGNNATAVAVSVWLPPAVHGWMEWNSSSARSAANTAASVVVRAGLADLPLFARIGAAIPTLPLDSLSVLRSDAIVWTLVGGGVDRVDQGKGSLYFDDGETTEYEDGVSATQSLRWTWQDGVLAVTAAAAAGRFAVPPTMQTLSIDLRGFKGGALPTSATSNGAMACVKTVSHSLARPAGTVVCTAAAKVAAGTAMAAKLQWE